MNLVERIKGILLQPKSEWQTIEREPGDAGYLFPNYGAIVAAIPPVCAFTGTSIIGFGPFRVGIVGGILRAVVIYVLTLSASTSWPTSSTTAPLAHGRISTMP